MTPEGSARVSPTLRKGAEARSKLRDRKAAHASQDDERLATGRGFNPATFYSEPRLIGKFVRSGFDRKRDEEGFKLADQLGKPRIIR